MRILPVLGVSCWAGAARVSGRSDHWSPRWATLILWWQFPVQDYVLVSHCSAGECGLRKRWLVRLPVASNWGQIDSHLPWPVWTPFSGHVCVPSCFWCTFYWPPPTCFHNFYLFEGNMLEGGLTCHHSLLNSPNRSQQISLFCISPESSVIIFHFVQQYNEQNFWRWAANSVDDWNLIDFVNILNENCSKCTFI